MKKKLIKDILEIDKLLKNERKNKEKVNKELLKLNNQINLIEEKIQIKNINNNSPKKILNLSSLNNLYSIALKKHNKKIFIENNLSHFKRQKEEKEVELEKNYNKLIEKSKKNEEKIEKMKDKYEKIYEKARNKSKNLENETELIIISPDIMSVYLESQTPKEIEFMNKINLITRKNKRKNEILLRQIDSYFKSLTMIKSKNESSSNVELSTGIKNSSYFSKKNLFSHKLEAVNNNLNNSNEENDSVSSISFELETNLNMDELPSDDESLRFIDKVFDIKSNIKPIKNRIKSVLTPLNLKNKEKLIKVEPIKIEKPIDYKSKEEDMANKIEIINKEINDKKCKIEEIKTKKNNIEKENFKNEIKLKKEIAKIKIIKDQIEFLNKQMEDLLANNKKGKYYRILSINNIINNRNYCLFDDNENNSICDKETFRK